MGDAFGELVWDMGSKTALVLVVMYGVLLALKRFAVQQQSRRPGARIELLSTAALGPGRSVHLLTAGGKVLLVGATGQQVSLLAELNSEAAEFGPEPPAAELPAEALQSQAGRYLQQIAVVWRRHMGRQNGGSRG